MTEPEPIPFAGCFSDDQQQRLVFAGLACDSQSTYRHGSAAGPERIRQAYDGRGFNSTTEAGIDLTGAVSDLGDLTTHASWAQTAEHYRTFAEGVFAAGRIPFFAGGDHAVTIPILSALAALRNPVHVIQIDAHPDLYPSYYGDPDSHACVAARALGLEHVASLTQVGIRTMNETQRQVASKYGERLHSCTAQDLENGLPELAHIPHGASVYLTVDLDAFDPAFAPGVAHAVPGGLTPRQVFRLIQSTAWRLVGMDAVEVNPGLDTNDRTAILAARILHEGMGVAHRQSARAAI